MDTLIITGSNLTSNDVVNVARPDRRWNFTPMHAKDLECRPCLKRDRCHEIMYGVNTGIASSRR
jgi:histidine ammonia-lyase